MQTSISSSSLFSSSSRSRQTRRLVSSTQNVENLDDELSRAEMDSTKRSNSNSSQMHQAHFQSCSTNQDSNALETTQSNSYIESGDSTMSSLSRKFQSSSSTSKAVHLSSVSSVTAQDQRKRSRIEPEKVSLKNKLVSNAESFFTSPDVRSLVKEIGTDFAVLESLSNIEDLDSRQSRHDDTNVSDRYSSNKKGQNSSVSMRLFGSRRNLPCHVPTMDATFQLNKPQSNFQSHNLFDEPFVYLSQVPSTNQPKSYDITRIIETKRIDKNDDDNSDSVSQLSQLVTRAKDRIRYLSNSNENLFSKENSLSNDNVDNNRQPSVEEECVKSVGNHLTFKVANELSENYSKANTNDTLKHAEVVENKSTNSEIKQLDYSASSRDMSKQLQVDKQGTVNCKAAMTKSISRIERKMSDLCAKLESCDTTKEAVDLLSIMISMVEKAWSVHSCGYDLGFKLCKSLREAGGLDIILSFIKESGGDNSLLLDEERNDNPHWTSLLLSGPKQNEDITVEELSHFERSKRLAPNLKLNLPRVSESAEFISNEEKLLKEENNLDHTNEVDVEAEQNDQDNFTSADAEKDTKTMVERKEEHGDTHKDELRETRALQEELVFLSSRLLSQCLTFENREHIVKQVALQNVVKLACSFTTMKSTQSTKLLSRSKLVLMRQSSIAHAQVQQRKESSGGNTTLPSKQQVQECGDMHAIIGTEILQHLFKHSEDTCSKIISLGGLQAILYACRSTNIETLRRCASALANLALYGGPDSQQTMIEQKAHVWLFPLAFNKDDNIQYYACLAIAVLVANKEIEADVLKSSTLDLVEPFVTLHEPQKFATSTTAHIHGQSPSWLKKLMPVLGSKREEARNLASFHFAMEAYIKKAQGQTAVFKQIGLVEPLQKVAGSPLALASKFACQALRLICEPVPHRLSQQVPLWTNKDVCEWISNIGFEKFKLQFEDSNVDGDLLLQLNDEMLERDIGVSNGIVRRRFLRELSSLKQMADYSSIDKTNLASLLQTSGIEFAQYFYTMLQLGVTRDNIHLVDTSQLLSECGVTNSIHKMKFDSSIRSLIAFERNSSLIQQQFDTEQQQKLSSLRSGNNLASHLADSSSKAGNICQNPNVINAQNEKSLDVFVSYRRSTGSQLASLLKVHLQLRGLSVFIDVERLEAGKFDNKLIDSIKSARNFVLVLSPNALDRCIGDLDCKDWVHKEIVAALAANCNIIPILDNFLWPDAEHLPEDMRSIRKYNGVLWIHDYQDACVDKIERFLRGEANQLSSSAATPQVIVQSLQAAGYPGTAQSHFSATPNSSNPFNKANQTIIGSLSRPTSSMSDNEQQPSAYRSYHPLASFLNDHYQKRSNSNNSQSSAIQASLASEMN